MVFFLGRMRREPVPCRFCCGEEEDGHLFWDRTVPPLVHLREGPEFSDLVSMNKDCWPRFMLGHGWLPGLSGHNGNPWAETVQEVARYCWKRAIGGAPDLSRSWVFDELYDAEEVSGQMPDHPSVWSDGSCVLDELAEVSVAGTGVFFS